MNSRFLNTLSLLCVTLLFGLVADVLYAQNAPTSPPRPKAILGKPVFLPETKTFNEMPSVSTLDELVRLTLENHPALQKAGLEIASAEGLALQAGLYPNPSMAAIFDELGDRTGTGGINTTPLITQEIVTAGKLRLSRSVAQRQVEIARFALTLKRMELITNVRKGFFALLAIQQRTARLAKLVELSQEAYQTAEKLLNAKQISELELLQFRVALNRLVAKHSAAERQQLATRKELAAIVGIPDLPIDGTEESLESALPEFQFDTSRIVMLQRHPAIYAAQVQVDKAQIALKRAQVEKYPNLTVGAGYVRQNQNKSDDWVIQFEMPIPLWDRNQGNVQAAQAKVGHAVKNVQDVELLLTKELAAALGRYAAARKQVEKYRSGILKDADRAYELSLKAFQAGQFEYLRVITAQQAIAEANLEYIDLLSQAWQAASEVAGLLQMEQLQQK